MGLVLVVDDEAMIRDLTRRILTKGGHEVISVETAAEALDAFSQHAGAISVVVLDYSLPGTSGIELLKTFRATRPGLPSIISSGFALEQVDLPVDIQPHTFILQKPYRSAQLLEAVQSAVVPQDPR